MGWSTLSWLRQFEQALLLLAAQGFLTDFLPCPQFQPCPSLHLFSGAPGSGGLPV